MSEPPIVPPPVHPPDAPLPLPPLEPLPEEDLDDFEDYEDPWPQPLTGPFDEGPRPGEVPGRWPDRPSPPTRWVGSLQDPIDWEANRISIRKDLTSDSGEDLKRRLRDHILEKVKLLEAQYLVRRERGEVSATERRAGTRRNGLAIGVARNPRRTASIPSTTRGLSPWPVRFRRLQTKRIPERLTPWSQTCFG